MTYPAMAQGVTTVATGPGGRAMAEPMAQELLARMQAHLNLERQSAAFYLASAIWHDERELAGFAEHLHRRSQQHQNHSAAIADYLISRGQTVELDAIEPPPQDLTTVEAGIAEVFRRETDVTTSVLQLYSNADRDLDQRSTVVLDPMVDRQRESEHQSAYLLGRVKFAANQPDALMIIDAELRNEEAKAVKLTR